MKKKSNATTEPELIRMRAPANSGLAACVINNHRYPASGKMSPLEPVEADPADVQMLEDHGWHRWDDPNYELVVMRAPEHPDGGLFMVTLNGRYYLPYSASTIQVFRIDSKALEAEGWTLVNDKPSEK